MNSCSLFDILSPTFDAQISSILLISEFKCISLLLHFYLQNHDEKNLLPLHLIKKANDIFDELLATSAKPVLVHGDLHQDNVLSSNRSEWLAIDPKGIAAEPCYETAAMIRNPYEKMKCINELKPILRKRILKYCFAQTILSAV